MKRPLKELIQKHYGQFQLNSQQLNQLSQIQTSEHHRKRRGVFGAVFILAFLAIAGVAWLIQSSDSTSSFHWAKVREELAYHHHKDMEMEVESPSFEKVKEYLSQLDFSLIQSQELSSDKWELVGGRYCSLQGRLAAQLRYRNKESQKYYTVYQLAYPAGVPLDGPIKMYERGVAIKIWKEKGLLFGIAGEEI
ncbi:MAG: hypothetical protein COV44_03555 [Deltaproteobacteria bacterium CG11_big_fil_rev_8_21_14_0_20_45_16]|nr:MAG: hypothetical protein COV44_03555 [Deltaproteobacteria bacterium CG11_big_fil_rev_8_21_14_0_20_45_16]